MLASSNLPGALLGLFVGFSVVTEIRVEASLWLVAVTAWCAALMLWGRLRNTQRVQAVTFLSFGFCCLVLAHGSIPSASLVLQALTKNHLILALLIAVYFLRLAAEDGEQEERTTSAGGVVAYLQTMLSVHVFGAVINMSALVLVAERMALRATLRKREALLLTRAFSVAVFYSPFIAGMAVALEYAPGAELLDIMRYGVPLACAGLLYNFVAACLRPNERWDDFKGYPVRLSSVWLPLVLALTVFAGHAWRPDLSVLTIVTVASPLIVFALLLHRHGLRLAGGAFAAHIIRAPNAMSGELVLFLSAGVLAVGLGELLASYGTEWLPLQAFGAGAASMLLLVMVVSSAFGLHPIIAVTTVAAVIAPLAPAPLMLATLFVMAWGLGTACSPLSGTNLTLQGRFGFSAWDFPRWNVLYLIYMWLVCVVLLNLIDVLG